MNQFRIAVAGVGVVALVVIGVLANAQSNSGRNIKLFPQAGEPYDTAGGDFFITPDHPTFNRFSEFTVHSIPRQSGVTTYGVYISTPSIGRVRLKTFDMSGARFHQTFSGFGGVPDEGNPLWDTETITIEVYLEVDDGFDAPDIGGLLVLRGVDP